MTIEKYSMGIGDRFSMQGKAQLKAMQTAEDEGTVVVPVWNKSKREHVLIGSSPADVRKAADEAVKALGWKHGYYVDADHIGIKTVDDFIPYSDFYTIDVADFIGKEPEKVDVENFLRNAGKYLGTLVIPDVSSEFIISEEKLREIGGKYLFAIKEAKNIYNRILSVKGNDNFVTEVSLDENKNPQTPEELFFILLGLSMEKIPVQTVAPKFTGEFFKGIDYVGDIKTFIREFEDDIAVIKYAIKEFNLPQNLKLSIHSGSDKFSLYNLIYKVIKKHNAGLHLKTAGTTWLEELIGLAESGGEGLAIAKEIYRKSIDRMDELIAPYLTVVRIDKDKLPSVDEVEKWDGNHYAQTLRHDQSNQNFNIHFRQLLHLGYKIAAELGDRYLNALVANKEVVGKNVYENIFNRHLKPLFLGK